MSRTLKTSRWLRVVCATAFLLFVAGFFRKLSVGVWDWSTLALAGFSLIGLLGLIDALTCSIELLPDRMKVVQNFRKREYAKLEVVDVAWAKGVGVKLRLSNGRFEELPEVGDGSSSLAAHIRNWLRGNADAV